MPRFAKYGWHATDDLPEFADPLIEEIDTDASFKGHARIIISNSKPSNETALYDHLFGELLKHLIRRYREDEHVRVIFEGAGGRSIADYQRIVGEGIANVSVETQAKGGNLLALADYLLYATIQYVARVAQVCKDPRCQQLHTPPVASSLNYDSTGRPIPSGHLSKDDRWHKLYFAFARSMSSIVILRSP